MSIRLLIELCHVNKFGVEGFLYADGSNAYDVFDPVLGCIWQSVRPFWHSLIYYNK